MRNINTEDELHAAIAELEATQIEEGKLLKQDFQMAYDSIKPINLIKSTLEVVTESKVLRQKVLSTGLGLATGFASKLLFEGLSPKPIRKFLGSALMFGITSIISKNGEIVKSATDGLLNFIKGGQNSKPEEKIETEG